MVDALAGDAKQALIAVSSGDAAALKTALQTGSGRSSALDSTITQLRADFGGLPGDGPGAATEYSNAILVRRASLLAALDTVGSLSGQWASVTALGTEASALTEAIRSHDTTLASGAAAGVKAEWAKAVSLCNQALAILAEISTMRSDFVQADQGTVLDDWIAVHLRYDKALLTLYQALQASGGVRNAKVDAAYREQALALAQLPADNRQIVVIISEVAQGGLNQAVVAIEVARGAIDAAIAAAGPS